MFGKPNGAARGHIDVSLDRLSEIVILARACESHPSASSGDADPAPGANAAARELRHAIDSLAEDERAVLLALAWIGRGDFSAKDFDVALTRAFDRHAGPIAEVLAQVPRLGDVLERGAVACGADLSQISSHNSGRPNGLLH